MPATTYSPDIVGSRVSLPESPVVVHSTERSGSPSLGDKRTAAEQFEGTTTGERLAVRVPRVMRPARTSQERFILLQKWEGVVLEVDDETFTARLLDSHGSLPPQQAIFSRDELSPEEQSQIEIGAPFIWTIGYRHIGATRHRDSTIYFRRLPPWTESEFQTARARADKLATAIGWR